MSFVTCYIEGNCNPMDKLGVEWHSRWILSTKL